MTTFLERSAFLSEPMVNAELLVDSSDTLLPVVTLTGSWLEHSRLPSAGRLESSIIACRDSLQIVPGRDFEWDSRLLAFLLSVERLCASHNKQLDITALPDSVCHLHELATAVAPNVSPPPSSGHPLQFLMQAWSSLVDTFVFIGEMGMAVGRLVTGRSDMRAVDAVSCLRQSGPKAIAIISLISVLVGMILAYLGMVQLSQFGAEVYVANLVAVGMVREMGALMTAVIMAGRTGAAWAAELGAMQVNEEVDALVTMGIRPMDFLVMPRLLAMAIAMPLLSAYSFVLGMIGGGIMALSMDMTSRMYIHQLLASFTPVDVLVGCLKGFVFGLLIVLAGCQSGMNCRGSSAAVGQATTRAVVLAIVFFVVADASLNLLFYKLGI